jgi:hypothetical protein
MPKYKITYGGWYQRTTLHLSEIYNFFDSAFSTAALSKEKLKKLQESLRLKVVTRENGYLEFVRASTKDGIEILYYEDGLYVLYLESANIKEAEKKLEEYFEKVFNPALAYLFSLGAPTPKELANIKTTHPTVVSLADPAPDKFYIDPTEFGEVYSKISSAEVTVFKTHEYIFVLTSAKVANANELIETQIFFREFKDQLEKYLQIHRKIWEEIASLKEQKSIRGADIEEMRNQLDRYQKTISLISNRLNQMGAYINTRLSISKKFELKEHLASLFQYKFETLSDTHAYIKELWKMTEEYLKSAIAVVVELKAQSTKNTITSLTVITTLGVIAGILGYLSTKTLPKITLFGVFYFFILISLTWLINLTISFVFKQLKYKLSLNETEKNL